MAINRNEPAGVGLLNGMERPPIVPIEPARGPTANADASAPYQPVPESAPYPPMNGQAVAPVGTEVPRAMSAPRPGTERPNPLWWLVLAVAALVVFVTGAVIATVMAGGVIGDIFGGATGKLVVDTQTVALGDAKTANVNLDMNAGDIIVKGDAQDLMAATFTYNVAEWKPDVNYKVNGELGTLSVVQPDERVLAAGNTRNKWELRLNNDVPTTLDVNLGAGNIALELGGMNINELTVDNGSGNTTIDLSGPWESDLDAKIVGAVGNMVLRLPSDTGVKVVVTGSVVGDITADGFTQNGNVYTNDAYGKSPVTLNINTMVSVGNLTLDTVK